MLMVTGEIDDRCLLMRYVMWCNLSQNLATKFLLITQVIVICPSLIMHDICNREIPTCDYKWWHHRQRSLADTRSRMMSAYCDTQRQCDSCAMPSDTRQCQDTTHTTREQVHSHRSDLMTWDVNSSPRSSDLTCSTNYHHHHTVQG